MNSKYRQILLLIWLSLAGLSQSGMASDSFVQGVLGELPAEEKILLRGEVLDAIRTVYGSRYPASSVSYWEKAGRRVWILKSRGKHGYVEAGFVTEAERLVRVRVLDSKEVRGKVIETERFLKQFVGSGLDETHQLDQRVDGVSGATVSVNALKKMALVALVLDSFVSGGISQ